MGHQSHRKKILDVGCGTNKFPGAIGLDYNPRTDADVIHDLGITPYPFTDNEFDEVISQHVVEHVPDVMAFMTELHRITKPGGLIRVSHAALLESRLSRLTLLIAIISIAIHFNASIQSAGSSISTRRLNCGRFAPTFRWQISGEH
ncbi:MAG: class I SAM-dependent methyltransferase [Pyrinomonadaceae bacterium]